MFTHSMRRRGRITHALRDSITTHCGFNPNVNDYATTDAPEYRLCKRCLRSMSPPLTKTERTTLLLSRFKTAQEVADLRGVSVHTVRNTLTRIRRKLGVKTTHCAVMRAIELKIIRG